ncbi:MAG: hypothetical protein IJ087_12300 [Eggerthellaceae bacterium]|nr:hypothetical protein [Eggerthellaceae bacterium]
MKPGKGIRAVCFAAALLPCLAAAFGCASSDVTPLLELPESIVVHSDGVESEYTEGEHEFVAAFNQLKSTALDSDNLLETAIDPEMELKEGRCIEFVYGNAQHTGEGSKGANSVIREYDRLLFFFSGPNAGEVVLGLDGRYMSGTYKTSATLWPY